MITEYAKKAFDTGKKNHNEEDIRKVFVDTFINAYKKDLT